MASVLYSQKFAKGQPIVVEGDPGSSYYIIKEVIDSCLRFISTNKREVFQ